MAWRQSFQRNFVFLLTAALLVVTYVSFRSSEEAMRVVLVSPAVPLAVYPAHSLEKIVFPSLNPNSTDEPTKASKSMSVILKTSAGDITLELDAEAAPLTVDNFIKYAKDGHYDGTIFHRVIKDFMIQAGGFTPDMNQKKTRETIKNESSNGLSNLKYSIAMARTSAPDSASSQFFINTKDNLFLDKKKSRDGVGYCVFGKVTDGIEIVDKIGTVATARKSGMDDVPVDTIEILSVEIKKD